MGLDYKHTLLSSIWIISIPDGNGRKEKKKSCENDCPLLSMKNWCLGDMCINSGHTDRVQLYQFHQDNRKNHCNEDNNIWTVEAIVRILVLKTIIFLRSSIFPGCPILTSLCSTNLYLINCGKKDHLSMEKWLGSYSQRPLLL